MSPAHTWQSARFELHKKNKLMDEGFAEWVSFKAAEYFGFAEEMEAIERRMDTYGRGFNRFRAVEMSRGINGVFRTPPIGAGITTDG